jgi:hypothetical protein
VTTPGPAGRLGITPGALVQSLGGGSDGLPADQAILDDIRALSGEELVPLESDEILDVVLVWFRAEDGDLVDTLVDARRSLDDGGVVWLMTPKRDHDGHVQPADVQEAVPTAGLQMTSTISASPEWSGSRLVAPKTMAKKR